MTRTFLLTAALVLLAWQRTALAHSTLDRSEPREGAVLKALPNELRIWFTEPIKAGLSTIEVRNESGKQIDRHDLLPDKKESTLVHLSLPPDLGPGVYKVTWSAVAQDLHVTKGSFVFRVAP